MEVEEQPLECAVGQRELIVLKPSANRKPEGRHISVLDWTSSKAHRPGSNEEDADAPDTSNEDVSGEETNEDTEP